MTDFSCTDRYQALGIAYPDPETMCSGQCEGIGFYPHGRGPGETWQEALAWEMLHLRAHTLRSRVWNAIRFRDLKCLFERCDGCHFIKCPDCGGTGKAPVYPTVDPRYANDASVGRNPEGGDAQQGSVEDEHAMAKPDATTAETPNLGEQP